MRNKIFPFFNFSFLMSILSVMLTGCASLSPPAHRIDPEQSTCPDFPITVSLQKKTEELKTLKGTAVVNIQFKDGREATGRAIIIIKRPDQFRFEILGPFNQIIAVIVYNGTSLSLLSLQENKIYEDYFLPVEAYTLPQYLTGLPASRVGSQKSEIKSQEANYFSQTLPSGQCVYTNSENEQIVINQEGNIKEITISGINDNVHPRKVFMGSYNEVDGFNLPFEISISNKLADIFIKYKHVELNQHVPEDLFDLPR